MLKDMNAEYVVKFIIFKGNIGNVNMMGCLLRIYIRIEIFGFRMDKKVFENGFRCKMQYLFPF